MSFYVILLLVQTLHQQKHDVSFFIFKAHFLFRKMYINIDINHSHFLFFQFFSQSFFFYFVLNQSDQGPHVAKKSCVSIQHPNLEFFCQETFIFFLGIGCDIFYLDFFCHSCLFNVRAICPSPWKKKSLLPRNNETKKTQPLKFMFIWLSLFYF